MAEQKPMQNAFARTAVAQVICQKHSPAQQSVHWTLGILRHPRQFSTPQPFSARTASRRPPQRQ